MARRRNTLSVQAGWLPNTRAKIAGQQPVLIQAFIQPVAARRPAIAPPSTHRITVCTAATALYYALVLLVGYVWYRYGPLLRQGPRDESGEYANHHWDLSFLVVAGIGSLSAM